MGPLALGHLPLPQLTVYLPLPRNTVLVLGRRWARSRLTGIAEPGPRSWIAAKAGLMAVLIVLPIPFGNVLPALALMLLGLGLVFRDGAAVLLSAAIATMAVLYTGGLGMAAWLWGMAPLLHWLQA